jgi:hypothetical protein
MWRPLVSFTLERCVTHKAHSPCTFHAQSMHIPCTVHAHSMHIPCTFHAHSMHIPCTVHAQSMHSPCTVHAQSMHSPCTVHAQSMHIPCTFHAQFMHVPCTFHAQSMHIPCPGHGVKLLGRLPCVQKVQVSIPARRMVPFFGAMALSLSVLLSGLCPCGASVRGRGFGHLPLPSVTPCDDNAWCVCQEG